MEIQEVAAEDMKIILDFIYGVLDTLPDERLQTLVLAADRLQVLYSPLDFLNGHEERQGGLHMYKRTH